MASTCRWAVWRALSEVAELLKFRTSTRGDICVMVSWCWTSHGSELALCPSMGQVVGAQPGALGLAAQPPEGQPGAVGSSMQLTGTTASMARMHDAGSAP